MTVPQKASKGGDKMFPDPDTIGMSIAIGEAIGLADQERITLQLAMEEEADEEEQGSKPENPCSLGRS